jgi:hypothetical protein
MQLNQLHRFAVAPYGGLDGLSGKSDASSALNANAISRAGPNAVPALLMSLRKRMISASSLNLA